MNNSPEISVILPSFNRRKKILRAIDSVLKQSFGNFELIIIDDGSTDNTYRAINPLLINFSNIKYLYHSNRGTANSLNAGINLAEGKFITFIDSDDEYEKEHLELRINFFNKNKRVDLIHTTCRFIGRESDMFVPDAGNIMRLIHLRDCIIGATFFGKKKVFTSLKGFKNVYSYDSEFFKRADRFFNVKKIDYPTYIYYRNSKDSVLTSLKNKIKSNEKK